MTTTVHLAVYDTLADWEFGFATAGINTPEWQRVPGRYEIRTVGLTFDTVTSAGGLRITPDTVLADLDPADSAMLILPGAGLWATGDLAPFATTARRFLDSDVPVAAICGATVGLAASGLLDSYDHTGNAVEELSQAPGYGGAARFRAERAVTDRGLVTAGAASPVEFAREIFAALDLYSPEVLEAWYGLFSTGDPSWFGKLVAATS
ncbi:DJ-1/PfpI family protein [Umezawaea endophytica]|uniref:DJ-1/PfpI family protein n=1 Tax=Umezawaea endophytica TaxID=1654476 RepID=A0A9X2ZZW0_9PSEU|nr:DJ-1/PfpI family protein [Umezawaea endophytica]MCS7476323.1 DJ-1/PfpI family protein [Umezawaea endophytica]